MGQGLGFRVGAKAEGDGEEIEQGSGVLGPSNEEMKPSLPFTSFIVTKKKFVKKKFGHNFLKSVTNSITNFDEVYIGQNSPSKKTLNL